MNESSISSSKAIIIKTVSFYKYLFSALMALCLFVLPVLKPRTEYIGSELIDFLLRCAIWLFFAFGYWSLSASVINRINKAKGRYYEMKKGLTSLLSFIISAVVLGALIWFLTRWLLLIFVPWIVDTLINAFAIFNGTIYSAIDFSQYFTLSDNDGK